MKTTALFFLILATQLLWAEPSVLTDPAAVQEAPAEEAVVTPAESDGGVSALFEGVSAPLGVAFKSGSESIDKNSYSNNLVYIVVVMIISILVYAITTKLREKQD